MNIALKKILEWDIVSPPNILFFKIILAILVPDFYIKILEFSISLKK